MKTRDGIPFWHTNRHFTSRRYITREDGCIKLNVSDRRIPERTPEQMKEILRAARELRAEREARGEKF